MSPHSSPVSLSWTRTLAVVLVSFAGFAIACGDLKSAGTPGDPSAADGGDGGTSGGPGGDPADAATGQGDSASDGASSSGGPVSGDPRWALWPIPADAPASDIYVVTNGANGATVKDTITGLEWQDTTSGQTYDFDGAGAYCDALVYNGASDWRMPTRIEAVSIMSIKPVLGESATAGPAFTPITASCTWTASRVPGSTSQAFSVAGVGVDPFQNTTANCAARCVRGGSPLGAPVAKQYLLDATTVSDPVTGLVWERNPPLTTGAIGPADSRCKALSIGTPPRSMRLPTFKELASIVDETRTSPASAPQLGLLNERVFSSNPRWTVNFDNGAGVNGPEGFDNASRCVSGP
ncbi:MAG: hypothetical protein QOI41_2499 [Myxococcales bacterium]|nr:hypothetical protein [Myxococcales bacterium]